MYIIRYIFEYFYWIILSHQIIEKALSLEAVDGLIYN